MASHKSAVPYATIETLFLDAGNTLICMDYARIASELDALGIAASAADIRRAEAAARPATSQRIAAGNHRDDTDHFAFHLAQTLARLETRNASGATLDAAALAPRLAATLKTPGEDYRLWSWVLPGVPEALQELRKLGLRLVVVSNSDGSVARALADLGLALHLDAIFDSHVIGFEKPDPRFFEHALRESGATAKSTVHVGDMYYQDVQGSRAAGVHSVLLDPYGDWQVADCERCRDLSEVVERIRRARAQA
jgi:HAD superfamily hydrolase (TIGR01662 family)